MKLYVYVVTLFIRWATRWARRRGRVVHYTHKGQLYMTRYALFGHLTGDGQSWFRRWFPNLYVHQMHAPDLDPSLHDHPWPWALSWVMLGGYCEDRFKGRSENDLARFWGPIANEKGYENSKSQRWLQAPALNFLRGSTFHRIAELNRRCANCPTGCEKDYREKGRAGVSSQWLGTWTLFLAGPRRNKKQWGYIVQGRGYVSHQERHAEFDGQEIREPGPFKPATSKTLDALGATLGLERRKRCRFWLLSESDNDYRSRIHDLACGMAGCP